MNKLELAKNLNTSAEALAELAEDIEIKTKIK